jgi:large subunit ribosomal protein L35
MKFPLSAEQRLIEENGEMPKIRTNRSAHKRFRLTGTGKVRRHKAFKSHILTKKPRKRKRNLRQGTLVAAANEPQVKRLIPYK